MRTRAHWDALTARLRRADDPFELPEFAELWSLACEEGPHVLAMFRRAGRLDDERIADLTRDLLVEALPSILAATNPRAYFNAALVNAARSWLRRGSAAVASLPESETSRGAVHSTTPAPDQAFLIDAKDFLAGLSRRERDALLAVVHGEDRDEAARVLGVTRDNLDQLVSRARRRFREEDG